MPAEVCRPLQRLTLVKTDWTWNKVCQDLYDKAKKIVKKDACMKFYDEVRSLNLETNASSISFGVGLLQVRHGMNCGCDETSDNEIPHPSAFINKNLSSVEWCYSKTNTRLTASYTD